MQHETMGKNKLNLDIEEIINDYNNGMSFKALGKKYNCSSVTIKTRLKKANINKTKKEFFTKEQIEEIIFDYSNGDSLRKIAKKFNCTKESIKLRLKSNNIQIRNKRKSILNEKELNDIKNKYLNGEKTQELADEYNLSISSLYYRLKKSGTKLRDSFTHRSERISNTILSDFQKEVIQGCLLGDGTLIKKPISSSFANTSIHLEYTEHLLNIINFAKAKIITVPECYKIIRGTKRLCKEKYTLITNCDKCLIEYRKLWYPEGIKIIPKNLILTPTIVKYWFYGDGSTSYYNNKKGIKLTLHTNGFTVEDCEFLVNEFKKLNIHFGINFCNKQPILTIRKKSLYDFFDYIGECNLECFKYKWKIPENK